MECSVVLGGVVYGVQVWCDLVVYVNTPNSR